MRFCLLILLLSTSLACAQPPPAKDSAGNTTVGIAPIDQSRYRIYGEATIDMTQVLVDENGMPVKDQFMQGPDDPQCLKCKPLTLGAAIAHALFAALPSEKDISGEQKFARGNLALRIEHDPHAKLTASEITVVKDLVGKLYSAIIISRVYPVLDPNAGPPPLALSGNK